MTRLSLVLCFLTVLVGLVQAGGGAPGRAIDITPAWIKMRGAGPYVLDKAGTTYRLKTDVTTEGTAFVVTAPGIVLDLNQHRVVYGNSSPLTVVNADFEEGLGREVPGWDLSGAPAAQLAANTNYLFGKQVLRFNGFTKRQRIVSGPIAIPKTQRSYVATITPGARPDFRTGIELAVIDTKTSKELASGKSPNAERGFSPVVRFIPTTLNPVRLEVRVTPPPTDQPTTVDLDAATLTVADDHAIMATPAWSGELPGLANLPPALRTAPRKVGKITIKNGRIEQGTGAGYGSHPLQLRWLSGLVLDQVETNACGLDTVSVDAFRAGNLVIRGCTFREDRIANVTNRMRMPATLGLVSTYGEVRVEKNRLLGSPQVGILADTNDKKAPLVIRDNEIRPRGVVTNGYGILLVSVQNFEVANNKIITENGRGIAIDGYRKDLVADGTITGNYVDVREGKNREYTGQLSARALRLRNTVDAMGPQRRIRIADNIFIARAESGDAGDAIAVIVSYANKQGQMNDAQIVLERNHMQAIVASADPRFRAFALCLDRVDPGIDLRVDKNVLESNDISLGLTYDGSVDDVRFTDNILKKAKTEVQRPFFGIVAGRGPAAIRHVDLVGTQVEGGADRTIHWGGTGPLQLDESQLLAVLVKDREGRPQAGIAIEVRAGDGTIIARGKTDAKGMVPDLLVPAKQYRRAVGPDAKMVVQSDATFTVQASDGTAKAIATARPRTQQPIELRLQ